MKSAVAILLVLILAAATFVAGARLVGSGDWREIDKKTDIIVVARPISTKDTTELSYDTVAHGDGIGVQRPGGVAACQRR